MLLSALILFAAEALALPSAPTHVLHEKRETTSRVWRRSDRVDRDAILPIRIGLSQSNLENAVDHLMDVSHPDSPNFGKHWTAEEVHAMYAPSVDAVEDVRLWLTESGVDAKDVVHSANKGWIAVDLPAWQAEELFRTEYHEFEHATQGGDKVKVGCDEYHVPAHLSRHIDYVTPGVALSPSMIKSKTKRSVKRRVIDGRRRDLLDLDVAHGHLQTPRDFKEDVLQTQDCANSMTTICIQALYGMPNNTRKDRPNALGMYSSYEEYVQEDLNLFFEAVAPWVPNGTHPALASINGGTAPAAPNEVAESTGEATNDLTILIPLTYPQNITLYQVDDIQAYDLAGWNTFLDALDGSYCTYEAYGIKGNSPGIDAEYPNPAPGGYKGELMCGTYKPTEVISISFGGAEDAVPPNYSRRQCNEFLKLGLQGVSVIWGSGDWGVSQPYDPADPEANNGCLGDQGQTFNPPLPTCPWVTIVGGTRIYPGQTIEDPESAMEVPAIVPNYASGGGFSNYFDRPLYQKLAVSKYFAKHDPGYKYYNVNDQATNVGANGGVYNRAGRAMPDVAAYGGAVPTFKDLNGKTAYGTSISAPIFASMITLINGERAAIGKGPAGFLNPTLYAAPYVFNDIVNGSNPGCGTDGFSAVPGWDPVTGLGSPSYPKLKTLLTLLP